MKNQNQKARTNLVNHFRQSIEEKNLENNYEAEFWYKLAPYLDEKTLIRLNGYLIDENIKDLKD